MSASNTGNSTDHLGQSQQKALSEFKTRIKDLLKPEYDDHYLIKWLKARNFDVSKTEKMFRDSDAYRKKMKVETILTDFKIPEVVLKHFPGGTPGFDKEGSPIAIELFGHYDFKGLMLSTKRSDLEKLKLYQCEAVADILKVQSEKLGKRVEGITVIFDMEGTSTKLLWPPGIQMFLHLVKVLEDNYPEMLKRMFVVNAPAILPLLWKIGRPLVTEDMRSKINFLGSNFQPELLKYIDANQLPAYLGGELTDPDGNPRCVTMICQGGEVPRSYYLAESVEGCSLETATVASGASLKLEFPITHVGSVLTWEFRTEDFDIGFGINFKGKDGTIQEIVPNRRVKCHQVTEDDSIKCDLVGTYVVVFDNTFSWTKDKKLHYRIEVVTSDATIEAEVLPTMSTDF